MASNQDPTPEQIAERCREIQRGWSDRERMTRLRVDLRPTYQRCDGVTECIDAEDYERHHESGEMSRCYDE